MSNTSYNRLLYALFVFIIIWKEVALNFVIRLPEVDELNAIWIVMD